MKTIISGPKPEKRARNPKKIAAVAGSCLAVAVITAVSVLAPSARGTEPPASELPETGAVRTASMDGYTAGADAVYQAPAEPDPEPSRTPYALEVRKSDQPAGGAWDPGAADGGSGAAAEDLDAEDAEPEDAGASAADPEQAAVPAGYIDRNGNGEPDGDAQALLSAKDELQAAAAELEATRRELAEARKALADAEAAKAAQSAVDAPVQAAPAQDAQNAQDAQESAPPDWLVQDPPEESGPPEWLAGPDAGQAPAEPWPTDALERAALANPYDGGPLCQASYAEIPCPLEGASTRMYVEPGVPLASLTQADLVHFALRSVRLCQASWATVIGTDGLGIQFYACSTSAAVVGPVDEYGQVMEILCYIVLTDEGYGIVPCT